MGLYEINHLAKAAKRRRLRLEHEDRLNELKAKTKGKW